MPMNKTFTQILWNFQSFQDHQIDEIYDLHSLTKPLDKFQNLLKEIDEKAPEVSDEVIQRIMNRIN
jgi:tetrahydromethanopterin S-methyltransferase subunit G